jgi:hypothetical protein
MGQLKSGFIHTVFFWLKDQNEDNKNSLYAGLKKLASINLINQAYIGQPAATNREVIDSSYDLSITFVFDDKSKQDIYQDHPDHLTFIDTCAHLWKQVQVYDAVS